MARVSLSAAAGLFVVITAMGAWVSVRADVPGEMLGRRTPGSVPRNIALGLGSGLSAPWPMPVAAVIAAAAGRRRPDLQWPGRISLATGCGVIAGILIEPVTWGRRNGGPLVRSLPPLGLASGLILVQAGRRALGDAVLGG